MVAWAGSTWSNVGFVAVTTAAMYCSVLIAARVAGRRTLAQLSAFDIIVTIALGSMLATASLSSEVAYADGAVGIATLLTLQMVVALLRRRFAGLRRLLDFAPLTVIDDGKVDLPSGPFGPQMTPDELASALRVRGAPGAEQVERAVLEPTGEISIVARSESDEPEIAEP